MKLKSILAAAVGLSFAAVGAAGAQSVSAGPYGDSAWWTPKGFYGALGYSNLQAAQGPDTDLSAVTAKLGARFGRYLGVEGEFSGGVGHDSATYGADRIRSNLQTQYAGYVVGFLPLAPQAELLARVGYGGQQYHLKDETVLATGDNHYDTLNYGAGAQYFFDPKDAVRFDYTRFDAQRSGQLDSDVFSLSWVRRF